VQALISEPVIRVEGGDFLKISNRVFILMEACTRDAAIIAGVRIIKGETYRPIIVPKHAIMFSS